MTEMDELRETVREVVEGIRLIGDKLDKSAAKFDREMAESKAKFDREMAESKAEFDRRMSEYIAENQQSKADYDRRMNNMNKIIGAWSNNHGEFAEEYFFNSFEQGKCDFFGEKFDSIKKNLKGVANDDEYDIVMLNGKSVCIVEIKFKARHDHVAKVINKAQSFRQNFTSDVEEDVKNNGIAVIKQVGDNVVVYDDNLRAF